MYLWDRIRYPVFQIIRYIERIVDGRSWTWWVEDGNPFTSTSIHADPYCIEVCLNPDPIVKRHSFCIINQLFSIYDTLQEAINGPDVPPKSQSLTCPGTVIRLFAIKQNSFSTAGAQILNGIESGLLIGKLTIIHHLFRSSVAEPTPYRPHFLRRFCDRVPHLTAEVSRYTETGSAEIRAYCHWTTRDRTNRVLSRRSLGTQSMAHHRLPTHRLRRKFRSHRRNCWR